MPINAKSRKFSRLCFSICRRFRAGSGSAIHCIFRIAVWVMARCKRSERDVGSMQTPGMYRSRHQANVPQLDVQVDRDKAKAQGVSLTDLRDAANLSGSSYVNDFNQFGRTAVMAQADGRSATWKIANLRTRNNQRNGAIKCMVNINTPTDRIRQ